MNPPVTTHWTKVAVSSWNRFSVSELFIAPSLPGAVHRFSVDGRAVEIRLPKRPPLNLKTDNWGNKHIRCMAWRKGRPQAFLVEHADVYVDLQTQLSVPVEEIGRVHHDWHQPGMRERFDKIAESGATTALAAFELWLRTLRWKSLHGQVGQRHLETRPAASTYLCDAGTSKRFYGSTIRVIASAGNALVSRADWNRTQEALKNKRQPPVWFDFLFEGEHRVNASDLHGGVLCLAIACEVVVRTLMKKHLATPINQEYLSMVELGAIRRILDGWKDLGYWTPAWQQATDLPKLKRLFELRNRLAHKAAAPPNQAECTAISLAARRFIIHASRTAERLSAR